MGNAMFSHLAILALSRSRTTFLFSLYEHQSRLSSALSNIVLVRSLSHRAATPGHLLDHFPKHGYDCHRRSPRSP